MFLIFLIFGSIQVTSRKDQEQYWVNTHRPYRFIPVRELAEMFKRFHVGSQMLDELSEPFDKAMSHKAALATDRYATSKFELFKAVFNREWLLMKRNSVVTIFKCIQVPHPSLSHPQKLEDSTPFPEADFVDLRCDK